jgi:hypothetical protein
VKSSKFLEDLEDPALLKNLDPQFLQGATSALMTKKTMPGRLLEIPAAK